MPPTTTTILVLALISLSASAVPQARQQRELPPTLGLDRGTIDLDLPAFTLKLVRASQTVAALQPKGAGGFDFTPADRLVKRAANGYHHLGDLTLRVRKKGGQWQDYDTAQTRQPVTPLTPKGDELAAADLSPTLSPDCPLQITRIWKHVDGALGLRFVLKNTLADPVEIGGLGIPMVFNNILSDRKLKQSNETCSFFDPYLGQDAGYLQVTRLMGSGPALVVTPLPSASRRGAGGEGPAGAPNGGRRSVGAAPPLQAPTPFEAWTPLNEPTRPSQTFEGTFAWMVHSKAYAEKEWSKAVPWNPPTSAILQPGESRSYGVQFLVSPAIRSIERTLQAAGRPVAVGVPGYVLPMDQEGKLFLKYRTAVTSISVDPAGAMEVRRVGPGAYPSPDVASTTEARKPYEAYVLRGKKWGRARVTFTYLDGTRQAIHYYVTKPAAQAVADLGRFLFSKQWFVDPADPFHRSPSVMSYDREADKLVTQDSRVWIAGLGDEGGSGSWVAAGMKLFAQPEPREVEKYAQFVDKVLWGGLQFSEGPNKYGVRKSLFYYDPKELPDFPYDLARDWRSWTSWNKRASEDIGRGYNYPHVVAAYWSLYRVARYADLQTTTVDGRRTTQGSAPGTEHAIPGSLDKLRPIPNTPHPWSWYLNQAYETTKFAFSRDARGNRRVGYVELGLMEGTIFLALLEDLKHEGWHEKATEIEALMKERVDRWSREEYPFGSEMAWDSTGQEEVYAWCRYFGQEEKAAVSLSSILGYMPTIPHWGYNGNARRYWDFLYGGKLTRIERQIHHYGSGLNALPVLAEYRRKPDDFYLLRVGYGGMMGALSNIDQEGFASVAFHSYPNTLKWDAYSGDYGPNFFGHAMNAATYVVNHPEFGWLAFGGNVILAKDSIRIRVLDSMRQRLFIAPLAGKIGSRGLWLTLDSGRFDSVEINRRTSAVRLGLTGVSVAHLRIEGWAKPSRAWSMERGAYVVPLKNGVARIELRTVSRGTGARPPF